MMLTAFVLLLTLGGAPQNTDDPFLGVWKLNVAKSKFENGNAPKTMTVRWEKSGAGVKVSAQGTDANGATINFSYVAIYDGKEYPPPGKWNWDTVANKQVDARNREDIFRKDGRIIGTERRVVSDDSKTLTVTSNFADAKSVQVFERQ